MKKKLAVLLAGTMVMASLVGCGGDAPAETTAPAEEAPAAEAEEEAPEAEEEAPAADAEEEAPAEDAEAEAPAASGETISVGFAQVGHESDWRAANTQNY